MLFLLLQPKWCFDGTIFHTLLLLAEEERIRKIQDTLIEDTRQRINENESPELVGTSRSQQPSALPIDSYERSIIDMISKNRVVIINGETGCGKSTRVPCMITKANPVSFFEFVSCNVTNSLYSLTFYVRMQLY
jgi:hypothetical protein